MNADVDLTPLERAVMGLFLSGDDPTRSDLRRQLAVCTATRVFTGVGFCTYFDVPRGTARAQLGKRTVLDGVSATIKGLEHGAGFALFVVEGLLHMLEGFTFDEPWPSDFNEFEVRYDKAPPDTSVPKPPGPDDAP